MGPRQPGRRPGAQGSSRKPQVRRVSVARPSLLRAERGHRGPRRPSTNPDSAEASGYRTPLTDGVCADAPDQWGSSRPQGRRPQTSRPRRVAEAALIRLHMLWWGCRLVRGCAYLWRRWRMFDMWVSRMQTKAPRPGPRTGLRRSKASLTHRAPGLQRANTWAIGLLPAGLSTAPTPEQRRW